MREFKAAVDPFQFKLDTDTAKGKFKKEGLRPTVVAHHYLNRRLLSTR